MTTIPRKSADAVRRHQRANEAGGCCRGRGGRCATVFSCLSWRSRAGAWGSICHREVPPARHPNRITPVFPASTCSRSPSQTQSRRAPHRPTSEAAESEHRRSALTRGVSTRPRVCDHPYGSSSSHVFGTLKPQTAAAGRGSITADEPPQRPLTLCAPRPPHPHRRGAAAGLWPQALAPVRPAFRPAFFRKHDDATLLR